MKYGFIPAFISLRTGFPVKEIDRDMTEWKPVSRQSYTDYYWLNRPYHDTIEPQLEAAVREKRCRRILGMLQELHPDHDRYIRLDLQTLAG